MTFSRRFDDKILSKKNAWLWAWFDIPGGVWLTVFSSSMIAMWWMAWRRDRDIPTGIVTSYSVVVTAFAASNIARWYRSYKCGQSAPVPSSPPPSLPPSD